MTAFSLLWIEAQVYICGLDSPKLSGQMYLGLNLTSLDAHQQIWCNAPGRFILD